MPLAEIVVAVTDYTLVLLCGVFAARIAATNIDHSFRRVFILFFVSIALASAFGGTVHAFFADPAALSYRVLWTVALLSIGMTATCIWLLGALLIAPARVMLGVYVVVVGLMLTYAACVLFVTDQFWIAIAMYLPATIFFLGALVSRWLRSGEHCLVLAIVSTVLSLGAAALQYFQIGIHATYFNHNATYHLVEGIALFMMFASAQKWRIPVDIGKHS